jgi:hypothetical protein
MSPNSDFKSSEKNGASHNIFPVEILYHLQSSVGALKIPALLVVFVPKSGT